MLLQELHEDEYLNMTADELEVVKVAACTLWSLL